LERTEILPNNSKIYDGTCATTTTDCKKRIGERSTAGSLLGEKRRDAKRKDKVGSPGLGKGTPLEKAK